MYNTGNSAGTAEEPAIARPKRTQAMKYCHYDRALLEVVVRMRLAGSTWQHVLKTTKVKRTAAFQAMRTFRLWGCPIVPNRGPRKPRSDILLNAVDLLFLEADVRSAKTLFHKVYARRLYSERFIYVQHERGIAKTRIPSRATIGRALRRVRLATLLPPRHHAAPCFFFYHFVIRVAQRLSVPFSNKKLHNVSRMVSPTLVAQYHLNLLNVNPDHLFFVDASHFTRDDFNPQRGTAPVGEECRAPGFTHRHNRINAYTVMSKQCYLPALVFDEKMGIDLLLLKVLPFFVRAQPRLEPPMRVFFSLHPSCFDSCVHPLPLTASCSRAYASPQIPLIKALCPTPVVVWDNGDGHTNTRVRALWAQHGVRLISTPPNDTRQNPIEHTYKSAKAYVALHNDRLLTISAHTLIRQAFSVISPQECANNFRAHGL